MTDKLLELKTIIAELLVETLKMNLVANDPYTPWSNPALTVPNSLRDSSLYDNISYVVEGDSVLIYMPTYAIFVDQGRRRNGRFPNITAIRQWLIRKFTPAQLANVLASPGGINTVVYLIGRSIQRFGIRPRPFIEQSIEDVVSSKRFDIALDGYIDQELIKIFLR